MMQQQRYLTDLLVTAKECSDRGLHNSAKWAAELAAAIAADGVEPDAAKMASSVDLDDIVQFTVAKTFFDLRQYDRTAHALVSCTSNRCFFLRCYALYLAGEMRKEDEASDPLEPIDQSSASNEELSGLRTLLNKRESTQGLDGYAYYLLGLIYKAQDLKQQALASFVKAVQLQPLHWGGWQELVSLTVDSGDHSSMASLPLPDTWAKEFFDAYLALELHLNDDALAKCSKLRDTYPASNYLLAQVAVAHYNRREFDESEEIFEQLRKSDPYRLDNIDTYSNILYVKELKPELSYLAHEACRIDQYRVETCCVIGNYYSLKNRHEKAVMYFRRALKLDRKYLSAWTLMGHEYVELKNTPAAIEAYRRAVEVNPRDYRAWYGLGQTYELLKMSMYSLYYYRQAQRLRPYDARMWTALAQTYKELNRWEDAAKCYERNCALNENDIAALHGLGVLYLNQMKPQNPDKAAFYFNKAIDLADEDTEETEVSLKAYEFLAGYYKNKQQLEDAEKFAMRLMNVGGKFKEQGKTLLKDIEALRLTPDAGMSLPSPGESPGTQPTWF